MDELPCRLHSCTSNTRTNAFAPLKKSKTPNAAHCSSSSPTNGDATPNDCASKRARQRRERARTSSPACHRANIPWVLYPNMMTAPAEAFDPHEEGGVGASGLVQGLTDAASSAALASCLTGACWLSCGGP